jgi:hypothetical protein
MPAYEIHGIREDGSTFGSVGFESKKNPEHEADAEAYSIAKHYARLWTQAAEVRLYRTPDANFTSVSSFDLWPGQVCLITTIHCRVSAPPSSRCSDLDDEVPF